MVAKEVLEQLQALGVRLFRDGDWLVAEPRSALTEEARALIRSNRSALLKLVGPREGEPSSGGHGGNADLRKGRALAFLSAHPGVKRACFVDQDSDPENVIVTVAVRQPWSAVEMRVRRESFDPHALMELSLRHPNTILDLPEQ